eukprot:COSAG06_NODE_689_length_13068_cov_9.661269_13_plen_117_part_00
MLSNPQYQTPRGRREAYDVFKPELERALSKKTVAEWCGKETFPSVLLRHLYNIQMIILPRQARDKHRENSEQDAFLQRCFKRAACRAAPWQTCRRRWITSSCSTGICTRRRRTGRL